MATAVEAAIAEIDETLKVFLPQYEGLQDFARLNIHDDTRTAVNTLTNTYSRRIQWLQHTREALVGLMNDGHPTIDNAEVEAAVFADLSENISTIEAAMTKFETEKAAALNATAGPPQPKP